MKRSISILASLNSVSAIETFGEELKIWRLSDRFSLNSFNFDFELESSTNVLDFMPVQFYQLVEQVPELLNLDVSLAQGRWNTNLVPRIRQFAVD
jgi:hypothetical protein